MTVPILLDQLKGKLVGGDGNQDALEHHGDGTLQLATIDCLGQGSQGDPLAIVLEEHLGGFSTVAAFPGGQEVKGGGL